MKSVRRVSIDLRTSRLGRILEFPAPWIALPVPWMIILSMILAPTRTGAWVHLQHDCGLGYLPHTLAPIHIWLL